MKETIESDPILKQFSNGRYAYNKGLRGDEYCTGCSCNSVWLVREGSPTVSITKKHCEKFDEDLTRYGNAVHSRGYDWSKRTVNFETTIKELRETIKATKSRLARQHGILKETDTEMSRAYPVDLFRVGNQPVHEQLLVYTKDMKMAFNNYWPPNAKVRFFVPDWQKMGAPIEGDDQMRWGTGVTIYAIIGDEPERYYIKFYGYFPRAKIAFWSTGQDFHNSYFVGGENLYLGKEIKWSEKTSN